MILRRLFTLTALTLAASLCLSDRANAGYDVSTSIGSTTGLTLVTAIPATPGGTTTINGVSVSTQFGGAEYTDNPTPGVGVTASTIFLVNFFTKNFPLGQTVTPSEGVYVTAGSPAGNDNSTWSFNETITVVNPSASTTTGTFTQSASYSMSITTGAGSATGTSLGVVPSSISVGGTTFFISNPQATSTTAGSTSNASVSSQITTVPEPASVVMLGVGLAGVVGLGMRRMKKTCLLNRRT